MIVMGRFGGPLFERQRRREQSEEKAVLCERNKRATGAWKQTTAKLPRLWRGARPAALQPPIHA